jgi:hypothetical protein
MLLVQAANALIMSIILAFDNTPNIFATLAEPLNRVVAVWAVDELSRQKKRMMSP